MSQLGGGELVGWQNIVEPEPITTRAGAPRRVGWILVGFAAGVLCSVLVMAWLA